MRPNARPLSSSSAGWPGRAKPAAHHSCARVATVEQPQWPRGPGFFVLAHPVPCAGRRPRQGTHPANAARAWRCIGRSSRQCRAARTGRPSWPPRQRLPPVTQRHCPPRAPAPRWPPGAGARCPTGPARPRHWRPALRAAGTAGADQTRGCRWACPGARRGAAPACAPRPP